MIHKIKYNILKSVKKIVVLLLGAISTLIIAMTFIKMSGMEMMTVISPSMEPEISPGDLLVVQEIAFSDIEEGMIICFTPEKSGVKVTHRVTVADHKRQLLTTKGDANENEDLHKVTPSELQGIILHQIPKIGYGALLLSSAKGKIALIGVILVLLIISRFLDKSIYEMGQINRMERQNWWRIVRQLRNINL